MIQYKDYNIFQDYGTEIKCGVQQLVMSQLNVVVHES
jgi:hypothetical protein